jgi:hypothetical protein
VASYIADSIRRSLLPWTAPDENPIRMIGLGPEILELGLNDDQLYTQVQMFARGLVIQFHPDRVGSAIQVVRRQRSFAAAYLQLKRRAVFDDAVWDLRQPRSAMRGEMNAEIRIQREKTQSVGLEAAHLRERLSEAQAALKSLKQENGELKARLHNGGVDGQRKATRRRQ